MTNDILLPPPDQRKRLMDKAADQVQTLLEELPSWPVSPQVDADTIRAHLARFDFDRPMADEAVLDEVYTMLRDWGLHTPHPGYYGLFNPAPSFQGVLADLLVAAFNPQVGAWHHNPAAVEMEAHLVRFFARAFGLPESAYGHFTSGGSEANFTGVVTALVSRFSEFAESGARGIDGAPVFFASAEAHHSLEKIAQQVGLGRQALRRVDADPLRGLKPEALAAAIGRSRDNGERPFLVVATAGTTNAGVVDPLPEIAGLCKDHGLHLHVDAAWGGSAILSSRLGAQLEGIGLADSITFDPHKLLSVPMAAGMFLCADPMLLNRSFGIDAAYVPKSKTGGMDNYQLSAQFSRRFIGLKLFMTLAATGRERYARVIERQVDLGRRLALGLESAGWTVVNEANLALVCFEDADWGQLDDEAHARHNEALAAAVVDTGQAWISTTRILGRPALRACVTSYLTSEAHIDHLIELVSDLRKATG